MFTSLVSLLILCISTMREDRSTNIVFVYVAQKFPSAFNSGQLKKLSEPQASGFKITVVVVFQIIVRIKVDFLSTNAIHSAPGQ